MIVQKLGEVDRYVHEQCGVPLIVTDDDISGTFTFLRALPDHGNALSLTPEQIGKTWLNYLIERKTILWWGGLGNSTEHTAYLRLKHGIPAPRSGSIALNGPIVAEQIGAQIFIDGWAMVSPGDPQRAADLARRAGSVSHDGEAIYGAQCLAAMESLAFVESDIERLVDCGVSVIPRDSTIARMIADLRNWHTKDNDWRTTFQRIQAQYGYQDYIGGCHIVPNHALVILGLLYGQGDFQKSLMICNTCGWDTDCNSGNLGCLLGIRNGLEGFQGAVDWRGPVADRLYLPTMDGGRCITDAVSEAVRIANSGLALSGLPPLRPKQGARFHFELPGSLQGFRVDSTEPSSAQVVLENTSGHSRLGSRSLAIRYSCPAGSAARVTTPTFILPEEQHMRGYSLIASPTLYPGQELRAGISAGEENAAPAQVALTLYYYDANDQPTRASGPTRLLQPGESCELTWRASVLDNLPIFAVGVEILAANGEPATGSIYLDYLTWEGVPRGIFTRPEGSQLPLPGSGMWRQAWVNAVDQWERWSQPAFRIIQNEGRGMITTGLREWKDYRVSAEISPALIKAGGLAVRVQGLLRYYALELTGDQTLRLVRAYDGELDVLAEIPCAWQRWQPLRLSLEARGDHLRAWAGERLVFDLADPGTPLSEGALGLVIEEGHLMAPAVEVEPV